MTARRRPLWVTVRGGTPGLPVAWIAWLAAVGVAARALGPVVGGGGLVVSALTLGWLIARRVPAPGAAWCRYHFDDEEVTVLGPGRRVDRRSWRACSGYAATARGLRLRGDGSVIDVPVPPAHAEAVWQAVLARLVPGRADALWRAHEHGAVRLTPVPEPDAAALASWAWTPAALVAALVPGLAATALMIALAALQCLLARARAAWRGVVLQPSGLVTAGDGRRCFIAWDELQTEFGPRGLEVWGPSGSGVVPADVSDFMAVAAVIRLRAQLGFVDADQVSFRVALDATGLAVVGEVDGG